MYNKYKSILLIQSFPTLTHVANNLPDLPKPVLVICLFNRRIYKFLRSLQLDDVKVISIGSGTILRKSALAFLRTYYIRRVVSICSKLKTENLILTYNNYSDMSALPIAYIKYDKLNIWIPYEEERYHYKKHEDQKLLRFQNKIAQLTNGLIEKRYFFGKRVSGHGSCVGLNPLHKLINPADRLQLPQISKLDYSIVESVSPQTFHNTSRA